MHRNEMVCFASPLPAAPTRWWSSTLHGPTVLVKCRRQHTSPSMVAAQRTTQVDKSYDLRQSGIGNSGLVMTEVSLGTMTWGQQNTIEDAHRQLDYAYERGVIGIDTAEMYPVPPTSDTAGHSEEYIGAWIRARGGESFRDKLVIASKVAGSARGGNGRSFPWIRGNSRCLDERNLIEAVDGSLKRLGTDYIDLLQLHWPDRYVPLFGSVSYDPALERDSVPILTQLEALDKLVKSGKVRNVGLSNETAWGVAQFAQLAEQHGLTKPVSIQNSYSLIYRDFEGHLSEACSPGNGNMGLLAYSPLAGGALTGKYLHGNAPAKARFALYPNYMKRFQSSLAAEAIGEYEAIAIEAGLTLTQLALAWCKTRWFVSSTIIGATTMDQLEANIDAFSIRLDKSIIQKVNQTYARYRDPSRTS
jgi:aryl-alcohol dehydrogenase-like predicted oxidoreductase